MDVEYNKENAVGTSMFEIPSPTTFCDPIGASPKLPQKTVKPKDHGRGSLSNISSINTDTSSKKTSSTKSGTRSAEIPFVKFPSATKGSNESEDNTPSTWGTGDSDMPFASKGSVSVGKSLSSEGGITSKSPTSGDEMPSFDEGSIKSPQFKKDTTK